MDVYQRVLFFSVARGDRCASSNPLKFEFECGREKGKEEEEGGGKSFFCDCGTVIRKGRRGRVRGKVDIEREPTINTKKKKRR